MTVLPAPLIVPPVQFKVPVTVNAPEIEPPLRFNTATFTLPGILTEPELMVTESPEVGTRLKFQFR